MFGNIWKSSEIFGNLWKAKVSQMFLSVGVTLRCPKSAEGSGLPRACIRANRNSRLAFRSEDNTPDWKNLPHPSPAKQLRQTRRLLSDPSKVPKPTRLPHWSQRITKNTGAEDPRKLLEQPPNTAKAIAAAGLDADFGGKAREGETLEMFGCLLTRLLSTLIWDFMTSYNKSCLTNLQLATLEQVCAF